MEAALTIDEDEATGGKEPHNFVCSDSSGMY